MSYGSPTLEGDYEAVFQPNHPRAHKNGRVYLHILIAEEALGKSLPLKAVVHHFDENSLNNKKSNLVICENESYHRLLHARQRILFEGGDPNLDKICCSCLKLKKRYLFHLSARNYDGLHGNCKECRVIEAKERWRLDKK